MKRLFDWRECHQSLLRTADECLDDDGKVLYGKKKVIERWEQKTGLHFMHNSLFSLADDVGLLPVIGLPRDFLHCTRLGSKAYSAVRRGSPVVYVCRQSCTIPRVKLPSDGSIYCLYGM